tara:strand:- start:45 stop:644 length:600 start_codon:yes stop_codon:yes gene_type:complete
MKKLLTILILLFSTNAFAENITCENGFKEGEMRDENPWHDDGIVLQEYYERMMNKELVQVYNPGLYEKYEFDLENNAVVLIKFFEKGAVKDRKYENGEWVKTYYKSNTTETNVYTISHKHQSDKRIIVTIDGITGAIYLNPKMLTDLKSDLKEILALPDGVEKLKEKEKEHREIKYVKTSNHIFVKDIHKKYNTLHYCR